jgi:hypothetical protein
MEAIAGVDTVEIRSKSSRQGCRIHLDRLGDRSHKEIINEEVDVNAQGGQDGNALQAASFQGHREIVELLPERGADVKAQGGQYGNAYKPHRLKAIKGLNCCWRGVRMSMLKVDVMAMLCKLHC